MLIGINAVFLGDRPTGVGVFTRQIIRHMDSVGTHRVLVYSSLAEEEAAGVAVCRTPAVARGSARFFGNLIRFAYINVLLPRTFGTTKIDVLYCPITEYPHRSPVPIVVHVHDLHPLDFPEQFGLAAPRFRWELGRLRKLKGRVTVSSRHVGRRLIEGGYVGENSLDVVPLGYDRENFFPADPARRRALDARGLDGPYLLYVGSALPYKNLDLLVKVFNDLSRTIPHTLVVAGGASGTLRQQAGDGRVRIFPEVSGEDLRDLYSFADAVVCPSLSEGFGLVPLEAMACGVPVVASGRTAVPEVVGDAALLVDPTDPDALSSGILKVVSDGDLARDMRERGLRRATEFSWERTARGLADACDRAAGEA